jgi:hypothetical protein
MDAVAEWFVAAGSVSIWALLSELLLARDRASLVRGTK